MKRNFENLIFRFPVGIKSRIKIWVYRFIGMRIGKYNRFENGRIRCANQIHIGDYNAFTSGYMLWPIQEVNDENRIKIGNRNFFNKNLMIDACQHIEIGDHNLFGPDVYITDANHTYGKKINPKTAPMQRGKVKIGDYCWIGAKACILKDVELGDYCVVAAGAVVTKSFPANSVIGGIPAKLLNER